MARINIEDSLFKDGRFIDLAIKMGSRHAALGCIVEAFIIAQEFFSKTETDRMIPLTEWKRRKAVDFIIDVGLAEIRGDFVYVCGAEKQFAWLIQKSSAGASVSEKKLESLKKARIARWNRSEDSLNGSERNQNGSEPPPLSPTLPLFNKEDNIKLKDPPKVSSELNKKIWESYLNAYRKRYDVEPVRNASVNSLISNLGKRLGEEAVEVVSFYVMSNNSFYARNCHPINLCLKDAESLRTQWKKGKSITEADVRNFERNTRTQTLLDKIESGDI